MGAEVGSQLQPPPASRHGRLLVLYASQTGTAMDAAERVGREAERRGCSSAVVLSVDAYEPSHLRHEDMVIFIISTTGQGDMPDSMKMFWKFLLQRNLGARWLEGVNCAVFGLGDSSYQKYNFAAKKLDKRLLDIGGTPIIERGFGDDQHPSGYEGTFDSWLSSLWKSVHQLRPSTLPSAFEILQPHMRKLDPSKFEVIYLADNDAEKELCPDNDAMETLKLIEKARSMLPRRLTHIDDMPHHLLHVIKNEPLTSGIDKDVRHLELGSMTSILEYQLGDVVEVLPGQNAAAIDAFIHRCNLDPDSYIIVRRRKMDEVSSVFSMVSTTHAVKLKTFVELTMDVASASPRRYFFEIMSYFSGSELEKEKLQYFASPEGRDDLYQYNQRERRTVLEVLEDFPSVQMPFEWLVQLVPPLKTRAFSISSSPLVHPREVHLTVSVVTWKTPFKRHRRGLCSSWLASLLPNENGEIPVPAWIRRSSLPAPAPSSPLILIGPGTGCAPFRAFIQERSQQSSTMMTAPVLFFFGCRNKEGDFLYRDFWSAHSHDSGALSSQKGGGFFVAFSRDQPHKVYVQHKMKEERTRIWRLLCAEATIYIAGSSNKMPADVTEALEEIISEEGGVSRESASKWLKQQERAGKFYIEAWS